jgi:hypothetical protein
MHIPKDIQKYILHLIRKGIKPAPSLSRRSPLIHNITIGHNENYNKWLVESPYKIGPHTCTASVEYYQQPCYSSLTPRFNKSPKCDEIVPFTGNLRTYIMCENCRIYNRNDISLFAEKTILVIPPRLPISEWLIICNWCKRFCKVPAEFLGVEKLYCSDAKCIDYRSKKKLG